MLQYESYYCFFIPYERYTESVTYTVDFNWYTRITSQVSLISGQSKINIKRHTNYKDDD
jgi:hypothetical protein